VPAWPWQAERETDLRRAKAKGATVLAHRLRLYLALHEGADALDALDATILTQPSITRAAPKYRRYIGANRSADA
jgi:uncharacterized protein (DUF1778 family)